MIDNIKNILETAIVEEKRAEQFYLNLAQQMKEKGARMKFEIMAETELKHYEILMKYYQEKFNETPQLTQNGENKIVRPDVPTKAITFDEAIKVIMDTEQRAYEFYKNASDRAEDPNDREILKMLANMERAHFDQFRTEYNYMTESTIRFSSEDIPWMMEVG